MKKEISLIFLITAFLVLSLSYVSALGTSMNESYLPGETMIVEIQGNILESIDMDEVIFKRGHVTVPFDYGVEKVDENYYIWAIAPTSEMDYTLLIKNVVTTLGGQIRQIDYTQNFSISGNLSDYAVKPGVINTDRDFEIEVMLYEDVDREIEIELFGNRNMTLEPGENTIKFSIRELNETGIYNIKVGRYILPAYLRLNETRARPSEVLIENISNVSSLEDLRDINKSGGAIDDEREKYHCYEFPGKICKADEICSGQTIVSMDGSCCVNGDCKIEEESGGIAWLGWLLAVLVIVVAVFIWLRYKKIKKEDQPIKKKILSLEKKIP